ncbi:hypothetical protein DIU31_016030 [Mucilaginibacter rubeus]|uniref:Uncharacterized protein n=1 Tax=Mucilaginibacter rubeus TaxID=2027860 RepID=A0AAE6JFS5_9SPHI|nr:MULTISPECIES: hypothetical protein [Mucilaginibacter]QEM04947.1 hypothetical protein DIU31_016030 [Mucilaginibacter rubeus]QEM17541.1 hypothetical protein DIU38_016195 [Mucilaginibacter gossypii]QTE45938.1 hypothetical protein J3L19_11490 [Mucilaginibacter rubeus]QTE52535.1 hypothetical protein J3L21_11460 [Mucilaginibacter rubeus]QTE57624.1 hypothetical protein J3L23_03135 [Mucilaginibacter rubeus]
MKKQTFIFLLLAFGFKLSAFSQQYVLDEKYLVSVEANQAVRMGAEQTHNQYLGKINNNIEDLNTNVGSVVLAQTIIYNGLSNVNSALKDGLEVKYMATITADMLNYLNQALAMGKSEPYLFLFASNIATEMKVRSVGLVSAVSSYVLKSGNNILADYNGRDQLLKKVTTTLQILDGLAYGAWRAMYWAKERGIIASINPWQNYINKDKYFVQEIINNAKYLHQ